MIDSIAFFIENKGGSWARLYFSNQINMPAIYGGLAAEQDSGGLEMV